MGNGPWYRWMRKERRISAVPRFTSVIYFGGHSGPGWDSAASESVLD